MPGHHERREHEHDARVDHRALDAALDLLLLLDLDRDTVEHRVEHAGGLAGLDHCNVEPAEHLRVPRHGLGQQRTRLDLLANVVDHDPQRLVVALLLEDHERRDDGEAGLDHRRELAREHLQRLRLDLLGEVPGFFFSVA